jgi:hypothetical protein
VTNQATRVERADARRMFNYYGSPAQMRGYPANINRHTGKPHEHRREIARNLRHSL